VVQSIFNIQLADLLPAFQGARGIQVQNSSITVAGGDHVQNITHNHIYSQELENKLKAILDAILNFRQIQQDTLSKATPGTILWLLECKEFKLFIDIDGTLKIMWGSGMRTLDHSFFYWRPQAHNGL
jgi:hypothetical protein